MRASTAILGGIIMLFVGWQALAEIAGNTQDAAVQNGTNATGAAWNMTNQTYYGLGEAAGPAIVWMGIGAFVLVATGTAVYAAQGGGNR